MTRQRLPDRRINATRKVTWATYGGNEQTILVTFGFKKRLLSPEQVAAGEHNIYRIAEVFCADFKAGSDTQAIVTDACVLISRLLQSSNDTVADLRASMCEPPSLIGCILQAGCDEEAWQADVDKELYVGADTADDEPIRMKEPADFPWAINLLSLFAFIVTVVAVVASIKHLWSY